MDFLEIMLTSDQIKMCSKEQLKTLVYSSIEEKCKKGNSEFDIGQGSFDGAESCELVGLYILHELSKLDIDVGLYRDDGLAVSSDTPRQVEIIKKK